jgi:hypothetical protein
MKIQRESSGIAYSFFNLNAKLKWVVTTVRYGKGYAATDNKGIHTGVYVILPSTHTP